MPIFILCHNRGPIASTGQHATDNERQPSRLPGIDWSCMTPLMRLSLQDPSLSMYHFLYAHAGLPRHGIYVDRAASQCIGPPCLLHRAIFRYCVRCISTRMTDWSCGNPTSTLLSRNVMSYICIIPPPNASAVSPECFISLPSPSLFLAFSGSPKTRESSGGTLRDLRVIPS